MPDTITSCTEEEYALFQSALWRWRSGWRPLFMYFRGPGGVPFFIVPILTLVGLWRFARSPVRLADADLTGFRGATVLSTSHLLGSYGMGGPGFLGLRLQLPRGGATWVVFTIWAAAEWLTINDDLLADGYFPEEQREPGSITRKVRRHRCGSAGRKGSPSIRSHSCLIVPLGTLAVRLTLPLVGRVEDFHLQVSAPCRAHNKKESRPPGRNPARA